MPPDPQWLLTALFTPALFAGVCLTLAALLARHRSRPATAAAVWSGRSSARGVGVRIAWALALGVSFPWGAAVTLGWPPLPPPTAEGWLILAVPAICLMEILLGWSQHPWLRILRGLLRLLLLAGLIPLLNQANLRYHWSAAQAAAWIAGLVVGLWIMLGVMLPLERRAGRDLPLSWALAAAAAAVCIGLSNSATLSQAGLVIPAILCAGAIALLLWGNGNTAARGLTVPALTAYAGLLIVATFAFDGLTYLNAALLAVAPFAAWLAQLPAVQRRHRLVQALARLAAVAGVCAAPVVMSALRFTAEASQGPW
jgi:hypothetical protein